MHTAQRQRHTVHVDVESLTLARARFIHVSYSAVQGFMVSLLPSTTTMHHQSTVLTADYLMNFGLLLNCSSVFYRASYMLSAILAVALRLSVYKSVFYYND